MFFLTFPSIVFTEMDTQAHMENVTTAVDHVIGTVASTLAAVPQMLAGEQPSSPAPADHDAHPLKFVALFFPPPSLVTASDVTVL